MSTYFTTEAYFWKPKTRTDYRGTLPCWLFFKFFLILKIQLYSQGILALLPWLYTGALQFHKGLLPSTLIVLLLYHTFLNLSRGFYKKLKNFFIFFLWSNIRDLNPCLNLGKVLFYHWTNTAYMVRVKGFEPLAPCSQSTYATELRYTPKAPHYAICSFAFCDVDYYTHLCTVCQHLF